MPRVVGLGLDCNDRMFSSLEETRAAVVVVGKMSRVRWNSQK